MAFRSAVARLIDAPYILAAVDTHLKERLVGAAVLVVVAVILIPEMLSGPSDRKTEGAAGSPAAQDGGVKTYTIDLGARARSGANDAVPAEVDPAAVAETPAPPPEIPPEDGSPAAAPETDKALVAKAPPATPVPEPPPVERPAAVKPPQAATSPVPEVPAATRPSGQGSPWVVQVGSFARQATADKLSQDLKRRGYASFVVPFKTGGQTLYRVRVGPMKERGDADAIVQKLKRDGTAATVVANS